MRTHRTGMAALAAATIVLGGCANEPVPEEAVPPPPPAAAPAPGPADPAPASPAPGAGPAGEVYGPGCAQVPGIGEGSVQDMIDEPVGTAAQGNPLLRNLVSALEAAGLTDVLNAPDAAYTVFAPSDAAFDALPFSTLADVIGDPQGRLSDILTYHVVPQRYDAAGLARAGTVTTVQGAPLTISGEPGSLVIDEQQQARVVCGNIQTANATVFVIDQVLMPPP